MKYKIYDKYGKFIKSFPTYKQAYTYIICMQRYDWSIK